MKRFKLGMLASVITCFAVFSLSSCKNQEQSQQPADDTTAVDTTAQATAPQGPQLNDAQIASAVVGANQIDVDYAKIAIAKSKNKDVINFANAMIKDHEAIIKSATALCQNLGVTPDDNNDLTQGLSKQATDTKAKLNTLSGADFDKAYIDNEVAFHDAVIKAVTNTLIPQAQNSELKQTMIDVSPLLNHHLEMAKEAQAKIESAQ